jgi:tRNA pseudouridine55 synthase
MTAFRKRGATSDADFLIACSPGFYVREFVSRAGEALGCGATLSRLRRLASGPFRLQEAVALEDMNRAGDPWSFTLPASEALEGMNRITVRAEWREQVANGARIGASMVSAIEGEPRLGELVAVLDPGGRLLGVHQVTGIDTFESQPRRMM